jgi:hypothetical protein
MLRSSVLRALVVLSSGFCISAINPSLVEGQYGYIYGHWEFTVSIHVAGSMADTEPSLFLETASDIVSNWDATCPGDSMI